MFELYFSILILTILTFFVLILDAPELVNFLNTF